MRPRFPFQLVTPEKTVFSQDVDAVTVDTENGQITILAHHTFLISVMKPGEMIVHDGSASFPLAISGGVLEMLDNKLVILADTAEHAKEIDLAKTEQRAKELAEMLRTEAVMGMTTYKLLQKRLEAEQAKLLVGRKWLK